MAGRGGKSSKSSSNVSYDEPFWESALLFVPRLVGKVVRSLLVWENTTKHIAEMDCAL